MFFLIKTLRNETKLRKEVIKMKRWYIQLAFLFLFLVSIPISLSAENDASVILQIINQCEQSLSTNISVNFSGRRSVRRQAELMANMTQQQLDWYSPGSYVQKMKASTEYGSRRVNEFETIIQEAISNGSTVSKHLAADAVDIAPASSTVKNWLENNGISVKDETDDGNRCWHLQLQR